MVGLGENEPYTGSLEARVQASNKEQVYGLVCPALGGSVFRLVPKGQIQAPTLTRWDCFPFFDNLNLKMKTKKDSTGRYVLAGHCQLCI